MPPKRTPSLRRPLLALIILVLLLSSGYAFRALHGSNAGTGNSSTSTSSGSGSSRAESPSAAGVALATLPTQARQTIALIQRGGPYPYSHDGIVYQNLERQLPAEPAGYYHEYTVVTPGSADRGARRIVTGKGGEFFYTANHYASFVRVRLTG